MQEKKGDLRQWLSEAGNEFLPHISLDCVIFGFHDGMLKILLLKMKNLDQLSLPGGFMLREETLEEAAIRTLKERTGLENIFLQQFHVFSDLSRSDMGGGVEPGRRLEALRKLGMHPAKLDWFAQRFI